MKHHDINSLPAWEALIKKVLWTQIGQLSNQRILDFGSGTGVTANHYAADNTVVAAELRGSQIQPYRDIAFLPSDFGKKK